MKETISAIEKWNDKYDADKEYWEDNFMEQINTNFPLFNPKTPFECTNQKHYTQYTTS